MEMKATRNFRELWNNKPERVNLFRGGARSSKTHSIMQAFFLWLVTGYFGKLKVPKGSASVIRATFPALRATVMKEFVNYLYEMDFYQKILKKN